MSSRKEARRLAKTLRNTRSTANKITRALQFAACSGDEVTVKRLLSINVEVDAGNRRKRTKTLLHLASKTGNLKVVKALLDYEDNSNEPSEFFYNSTPLHLAALEGHVELLSVFLSRGAFVDAKNKFGRTPLHLTTYHNQIECAKLLFDSRADINAKDTSDFTPFHLAAKNGCAEIARILLIMGADVNAVSKYTYATPLHLAADKGKTEVVKLLIDHKARLDVRNVNHKTPLYYAILEDHIETAELLFNYQNLDINDFLALERWDLTGNSLLYDRTMLGRVKTIKWLLSKGAYVNEATRNERTALHAAAGDPEAIKVLLSAGATVDAVTDWGETPLLLSAEWSCTVSVELLLSAGASVNVARVPGDTPLHLAALMGPAAVVNLLLDAGASVNTAGEFGNTPLHIAAKFGNAEEAEILLCRGADVNAANDEHLTPLHLAIDPQDPDLSSEPECKKVLQHHVVKKMALNLFVSESNSRAVRSDDRMVSFRLNCEKEIELMKSKKIANGVSFFDILTKSTRQLIALARNRDIVRIFKTYVYLLKFPIYASEVEKRFIPAIKRAKLMESGHDFFDILLTYLPQIEFLCYDEILMYLSNSDLQLLSDLV